MSQAYRQFSGEEIIADVLLEFPEAQEILATHGIACASCHINQYETLREGIIAHYGEDLFWVVMQDLNEAAKELNLKPEGVVQKDPVISDEAREKILEFQKNANQEGFGFRVEVSSFGEEASYFLDFEERPSTGDRVIESNGIRIFCDPASLRYLRNKIIDYQIQEEEEGFKFEPAVSE